MTAAERRKRAEEMLKDVYYWYGNAGFNEWFIKSMLAFADECVQAERERCALMCLDEMVSRRSANTNKEDAAYNTACTHCAAAIREGK